MDANPESKVETTPRKLSGIKGAFSNIESIQIPHKAVALAPKILIMASPFSAGVVFLAFSQIGHQKIVS